MVYFFSTQFQIELWAENLTISGVRIWVSSEQRFSSPKDLRIQRGILVSIRDSTTKPEKSFFALPGFCDAYTTLGVNPWGGEADPESLKMGLLGFLSAGFTQIESVGDGRWVQRVQGYISRNQWKGPIITQSVPPVVPDPGFPVSSDLYFIARSDEEIENYLLSHRAGNVHIFHRKIGSYIPDIRFLYKLRRNLPGGRWILHTFADPASGREALATGWDTIFHPIAFEAPRFQMEKIFWAPLMGVYYYQSKRSKKAWEKERAWGIEMSPFFQLTYGEISESIGEPLSEDSLARARVLYKEYESYLLTRSYMSGRLVFASGTGHPLVYPGLGGIRESEIWEHAMAHWEAEGMEAESSEIPTPKTSRGLDSFLRWMGLREERVLQKLRFEPYKVPKYRLQLLKALTEDTCTFLSIPYRGRICEGEESHLLLYDRNPLETKGGIHNPVSVYIRGRHVFGKKL